MKKTIIRIGDFVKIIKPEIFVRCGYDLDYQTITQEIEKKFCKEIVEFIKQFPFACDKNNAFYSELDLDAGYPIYSDKDSIDIGTSSYRCFTKIAEALAYEKIKKEIKTGSERKIFTTIDDTMNIDKHRYVENIKYFKTGIYNSGYQDSYGEWGSPFLSNEKVHKILILYPYIWIEDIHVIKTQPTDKEI